MGVNRSNYIWWLTSLRMRRMEINAGINIPNLATYVPNIQANMPNLSTNVPDMDSGIVPEATKADNNVSDNAPRTPYTSSGGISVYA